MKRLTLCLVVFVAACSPAVPENASGREIYAQVCASCHAGDMSGGTGPPLGPGSMAAERTDEFLVFTITRGRGRMPSFQRTLTEAQILRVVDYIREVQSG